MTRCALVAIALLLSISSVPAQVDGEVDWRSLCEEGELEKADTLCRSWLDADDVSTRVTANICLACIEMQKASTMIVERNAGGGTLRGGIGGPGVDRALMYLRTARDLAPDDLSIHVSILDVLVESGRYYDMSEALEQSLETYTGDDAFSTWLGYSRQFYSLQQFEPGVEYLKVLEQKYPDDHRVIANIGAYLTILERDDEALVYAERAVQLNPDDPINNWNLGRLNDYLNRIGEADKYYLRAIELDGDQEMLCTYAEFVENKLNDPERAARLREEAACQ